MTTPSHNLTGSSNLESLEVEVEVSTYYPIQNEDEEPITDLPLEPIKPRFFQVRTKANLLTFSLILIHTRYVGTVDSRYNGVR